MAINGKYGTMEFVKGKAEFSLKDGQKAVAEGLPANTTYEVKEAVYPRYTTTASNATGVITKNRIAQVEFVNNYNKPVPVPTGINSSTLLTTAGIFGFALLAGIGTITARRKMH